MPYIPKHAVLEVLSRPRLAELARLRGIRQQVRTKRELVALLACLPDADYLELLSQLGEAELRAIARVHHLPELGDPAALARYLAVGPSGASEPELPAPPPQEPLDLPTSLRRLAPAPPSEPPPAAPPRAPVARPEPPDDDDDLPPNVTRLRRRPAAPSQPRRGGDLGFEATLWQTADKLRSNMDAAEYKHVVLGLIFLKYVSDAQAGADRPRRFVVPPPARWSTLLARAERAGLGAAVDEAMAALEAENPTLRGVLPQIFQRPGLEGPRLGELVRLIDTVGLEEHSGRDVLGRVYEYFLTRFASAEGKNGGQFYTPRSVVRLLVAMLAPTRGKVYDPACGSGGMFVQSERFLVEHGGKHGDLQLFGQESNPTTWRLAKMNLAIRGIDGDLGPEHADSFHRDLHQGLRADYVLANPPFNTKDWGAARLQDDPRWRFGVPPPQNANFAWVQHIIHHLAPRGLAGFVLANGAMTASTAGEGEIRRRIIDADLIDCMVALPGQLFYSTQIPVSLWVLARDKADPRLRARKGEVLMLDARDLGTMVDRTHRELQDAEIDRLADLYHAWRGDPVPGDRSRRYADVPGLSRAVTLAEIAELGGMLAPGRFVAPPAPPTPLRPYVDELAEIDATLRMQMSRAAELDREIAGLLDHLRRRDA
jgi:type I restriction enzyme M protein